MNRTFRLSHKSSVLCVILCWLLGSVATTQAQTPGPDYAESVAIGAMSEDGEFELSLRLARFPARSGGSVWLHLAVAGQAYSLVDESVNLGVTPAVTPVQADTARFSAGTTTDLWFQTRARQSTAMQGEVSARLKVLAERHPEAGSGTIPVEVELQFVANQLGARLNNDRRWDLFGRVTGQVTVNGTTHAVDLPGKWHEQTGDRASFAPAFTYLNVQGPGFGMLAIGYTDRATGFVARESGNTAVTAMRIDPPGVAPRTFTVTLASGEVITGAARTVQNWSVPIEGQRRPGAGVVVDSNQGQLVGSLNDWNPDGPQ